MAERESNNNIGVFMGVVIVLVFLYIIMRPRTSVYCARCSYSPCKCNESMNDIMADKPLDLDYGMEDEDEMPMYPAAANEVGMNQEGQDMFYDASKMMPKLGENGQPEWTKTFENADNMLLQQNFIDTTDTEKFQVTKSVCGRRYMSRDLRRVPTVTRDPRTVNSFSLPYINPQCALEYNSLHPGLD